MAKFLKKISILLDNTYTKIFLGVICIILLIILFMQRNTRQQLKEVSNLPFHEVNIEQVKDGTYESSTYSSFLKVAAKVTVENHKITKIDILDQKGALEGELEGYAKEMIDSNTCEIPFGAKNNIQFTKLVFISCINTALYKGVLVDDKTSENIISKDSAEALNEASVKTD